MLQFEMIALKPQNQGYFAEKRASIP